jgi:hypothetical protein
MENQINIGNQNTQQFGQKQKNQRFELHKKVGVVTAFIAGIVVASITLIVFFYVFLSPRYERNLDRLIQEKQQALRNTQNNTQNNTPTQDNSSCPNCVDQVYNWEEIKEFYSIKLEEASWTNFESGKVGIRFEYPIGRNKLVLFEFNEWPERDIDPSGIEFSWSTRDLGAKYGNSNFAWGASRNLKMGRMSVDIYNWTESEGNYYVNSSGGSKYNVEKVFTREIKNVGHFLLYKNVCFFSGDFCDNEQLKSKTLIVNLPVNHRKGVESVLFNIPQNFTDSDIEKLVNSVDLVD